MRHLRTLSALRDTGSLADAAELVHLTQSALSHQMKDLEERLSAQVFIRKTRPVRFTSVGKRLLQLADEVLPAFAAADRDLARLSGGQAGRLFMAIECHSCFEWLLPAINAYRDEWPDVEMDLASGFNFAPLPALQRADLDLVITSDPVDHDDLAYVPLFCYEAVLAVAPRHPLARGDFVTPQALADQTLITYPVDRDRLDIFTRFLDPAGIEPASIRNAELTPMMVQLVASGRGVACLPNWALHEYIEKGYVAAVSLGEEGVWPTLYAAVRDDQREAAFVEGFVEVARRTCFANLHGITVVA